jgi:stage V sporulation protein S
MEFIFRSLHSNDTGDETFYSHSERGEQRGTGSPQEPPPEGAMGHPAPPSRPYRAGEEEEGHEVRVHTETGVLKVSAKSRPSAVAGAIAGLIRTTQRAEVQAIGAGATNQAIKAVAIAREYLREDGYEIVAIPAFIDVMIANEERTAIRIVVEPR